MTDLKKLRELAVVIRETDFESEDFNDTLLIDHVVAKGGTMRIAFEMTKPLRDFIAAANPQAIIELLDMVDRYEKALRSCEVRSGHIENWHRDHVTPDNFKDCQDVGVTPEAYLRETKMIAREALEGGK